MIEKLRNIAIIAHVDHGKTTLVDKLLQQSGTFAAHTKVTERMMDSNDIEKERGITILAKNTALDWNGYHINIVDTPGHADFGGEVERVLSMVDSVLLLVDAVDGPMPQTRFVTQKAFALGLKPIVVINKIDRPGARPDWVVDQTFDLFDRLGATDEQLDFPIVYASAINGYAGLVHTITEGDMTPLFETIVAKVSPPPVDMEGPFQMQVSSLDYNTYVGVIGIGLMSVPVLAGSSSYAISETFNWREGLFRKFKQAREFYFVIIIGTLIGLMFNFIGLDPIKALVMTAVFNGIVAVPLIYLIVRVSSRSDVMGDHKSGFWSRFGLWIAFIVMATAAIALLISFL